jgi:hypothetical protein
VWDGLRALAATAAGGAPRCAPNDRLVVGGPGVSQNEPPGASSMVVMGRAGPSAGKDQNDRDDRTMPYVTCPECSGLTYVARSFLHPRRPLSGLRYPARSRCDPAGGPASPCFLRGLTPRPLALSPAAAVRRAGWRSSGTVARSAQSLRVDHDSGVDHDSASRPQPLLPSARSGGRRGSRGTTSAGCSRTRRCHLTSRLPNRRRKNVNTFSMSRNIPAASGTASSIPAPRMRLKSRTV